MSNLVLILIILSINQTPLIALTTKTSHLNNNNIFNGLSDINCLIKFINLIPDFYSNQALSNYIINSDTKKLTFTVTSSNNFIQNVTFESNTKFSTNCFTQVYIISPVISLYNFISTDFIYLLQTSVHLRDNPDLIFLNFLEVKKSLLWNEKGILQKLRQVPNFVSLTSEYFCIFNNSEIFYINFYQTQDSSELISVFEVVFKHKQSLRIKSPKKISIQSHYVSDVTTECKGRLYSWNPDSYNPVNCSVRSFLSHFNYTIVEDIWNSKSDLKIFPTATLSNRDLEDFFSKESYYKFSYILTAERNDKFYSFVGFNQKTLKEIMSNIGFGFSIDGPVLLLTCLSFIAVTILMYLGNKYKKVTFSYIILRIFGILINQSTKFLSHYEGGVVFYLSIWLLASVIISQVLQGIIFSILTVAPKFIPPNNLIDLVNNYEIFAPDDLLADSIPKSNDEGYQMLKNSISLACPLSCSSSDSLLLSVNRSLILSESALFNKKRTNRSIERFAYIDYGSFVELTKLSFEELSDIAMYPSVEISFTALRSYWVVTRNQLGLDLYPHLAGIYESGIYEMWHKVFFIKKAYEMLNMNVGNGGSRRFKSNGNFFSWLINGKPRVDNEHQKVLEFYDLRNVFIVKAILFGIAFVIFSLEMIKKC